ncbi:MAG: heat-inducible transcription repressor HrcA [Elusimicrobia bacterium]|nr:heat-inducible transcription repressor HrcA [Elusimicrobiota bacterium]
MRALDQEELGQRKRKVLQYVIHEFVRTGKPVGSQSVASTSRLGLSPATIRHVLSELEKEDMIIQPHTSAGRVPTDKGYRLYVDSLVELQRLAIQEQTRIQNEYEARVREVEDFMNHTSRMLSTLSHYSGFVMTPKWDRNIFSCLELVPISSHRILCAMVSESGLAKHFVIASNIEISRDKLRVIARLINEHCRGCSLQEVKNRILEKLEDVQQEYRDTLSVAKEIAEEIKKFSENELYLDGTSNILALPDFSSASELQNLLKIIEEKQILANLLEGELAEEEGKKDRNQSREKESKEIRKGGIESPMARARTKVHVRIGSENKNKILQNISLVSSTYQLSDKTVGVLGILGPKRMEYPKMIALVDYVSQMVNRFLNETEKND